MPGGNYKGYYTAAAVIDGTSDLAIDGTTNVKASLPLGAKGCIITVAGSGIRWRADGTACSTGTGHYQAANSVITFNSWSAPGTDWRNLLKDFRFCPSSSGTCTLSISYFD